MPRDELLHRLLPRVYEAAVEPELWSGVLEELAHAVRGKAAALTIHNFSLQSGTIYRMFGYQTEFVERYADQQARQNPWLRDERHYRRPGAIITGQEIVPDDELVRTDFYTSWLRPQDLHHRLCGVLQREEASLVYLALMRPAPAGPYGPDERAYVSLVVPHLQRALQLHRRVAVLRRERLIAQEALDRLPTGILFLDAEARLIAWNRRAEEMLSAGDLLLRSGRLATADPDETSRLHRLVAACQATADGRGAAVGGVLQITRRAGQHALQVLVSPMRSLCELLGRERSIAVVFVSDPDQPIDAESERLVQLYGLTPVEAALALRLARGQTVEEASRGLRIAVNTGRAYLKRIFSKTGVHRQADLVRLVLIGPARLRDP